MASRIPGNGFKILACCAALAMTALFGSSASRAEPPPFIYQNLPFDLCYEPLQDLPEEDIELKCIEHVVAPSPGANKCVGNGARLASIGKGRYACWAPVRQIPPPVPPTERATRQIPPPLPFGGTCPYAGCDDANLAVPKIIAENSSEAQIVGKCLSSGQSVMMADRKLVCTPTPRALVKMITEACTRDPRKPGCTLRPSAPTRH